jgi:hypothetical protein
MNLLNQDLKDREPLQHSSWMSAPSPEGAHSAIGRSLPLLQVTGQVEKTKPPGMRYRPAHFVP